MQLVLPMSGYGERFRTAGYTVPKALIEVEGRPIVSHVVVVVRGAHPIVIICNREHLEDRTHRMRDTLEEIAPAARIVAIEPHSLGPVHAVLQAADAIDDGAENREHQLESC